MLVALTQELLQMEKTDHRTEIKVNRRVITTLIAVKLA